MIVGGIVAYPEELDRHMMFERNQHGFLIGARAMAGTAPRQRRRLRQPWHSGFCNLQNLRTRKSSNPTLSTRKYLAVVARQSAGNKVSDCVHKRRTRYPNERRFDAEALKVMMTRTMFDGCSSG
jgi:hypothetical protein